MLSKQRKAWISALALIAALCGPPSTAFAAGDADEGCSPQMRSTMDANAQNGMARAVGGALKGFPGPQSYNGMYCGNITDGFGQLNSLLSGSIFSSLVNNLLRSIVGAACQAALKPVQDVLANLCIPSFNLNYALNFNLGSGAYCNGIQLLRVNPSYNSPQISLPGYRLAPLSGN